MTQGVSEADGPGWGWDGDGDEDWDGAVLTLLALAVVAATALALHWFGSGQDQEAAGPASTAPRPSQVGGPGPALPPKSKVSGGVEGHSSGQGKPYPPGRGQGSPAAAGAQDQEPPRGGGLAATATPPLKTPGEVASGGALGQQRGNATPEAPRGKGREPRRPGAALLGQSKAEGTSVPLLIHFTPRSPGGEVEVQVEAGGVQAKAPAHQALVHMVERDTSPWQQGVASPGSLGRGPGSRRWQVDRSSGERTCRSPRLDPLSLGTVVSVWDSVGAASSLPAGSQGLPFPQELPPSYTLKTRPPMDVSERGRGKSSPQPAPVLALDSGAKATESREAGTLASRESQRSPASMEGWPWSWPGSC
ncbi:calcium-binding protein P-like [Eschrichtius robustus]|uniref:calcium-binding protein P-like n=1 Tax=Eschrichtius robustus TaxID=9764 RepID=UPI0035C1F809